MVIASSLKFSDFVAFQVERGAGRVLGEDDKAVGPFENHAHLRVAQRFGRQAANFEHQLLIPVVVNDDLRVRGLAGVLIAKPAAVTDDFGAERLGAQSPAGQVHLMDALVPQVAVAVIPNPVPIVV